MKRQELGPFLHAEVDTWSAKSYAELREGLRKGYERADPGMQYHVEVQLFEDRQDYVHVSVAVCSEHVKWSCFHPLSTSFLVYRNGQVEK